MMRSGDVPKATAASVNCSSAQLEERAAHDTRHEWPAEQSEDDRDVPRLGLAEDAARPAGPTSKAGTVRNTSVTLIKTASANAADVAGDGAPR